jgi:hypothetical protein
MKYCKDCKHFQNVDGLEGGYHVRYYGCARTGTISIVTGEREAMSNCESERRDETKCGQGAKYFEAIAAIQPKAAIGTTRTRVPVGGDKEPLDTFSVA